MAESIPNLIVIGSGKAGSTSLHNYLAGHPAIFGSAPKELMYFSHRFDQGTAWYQSHFPRQDGVRYYFESSPQYTFRDEFPHVARRIRDYNPDMKLIYIVREPLSRIVSHFNHWFEAFPEKYTDLGASLGDPAHRRFFVDRTRYHHQMAAYREFFPDNQLQVVFLEDLKGRFAETMNGVFDFLGVDPVAETIPQKIHNRAEDHSARPRPKWSVADISAERRAELCATLAPDVQALLADWGKPPDFWGAEYT